MKFEEELIIIHLLGIIICLIPFIQFIVVFWIWIAMMMTISYMCIICYIIPLYSILFPIVYIKPRSTLNQIWTGKGKYKIRAETYNPIAGKFKKHKIY
jgi:hypothetical protein